METLKTLISYIPAALAVVVIVVDIILLVVKGKVKVHQPTAEEQSQVDKLEKLQEVLTAVLPDAMVLAEKSGAGTGAAKKLIALSQIMLECNKRGLNFSEHSDVIETQVERSIELTKEVNA